MAELTLARDFPDATEAEWLALVEKALKGAPFSVLETKTYDGNTIEPLYAPDRGQAAIPGRAPRAPWTVVQRIDIADPATANTQALDDLMNGGPGLQLVFEGAVGDYGYALSSDKAAIAETLKTVLFDQGIEIDLDFSPATREAADTVAALIEASDAKPADVTLRFGFNPLSYLAQNGTLPKPWDPLSSELAAHIEDLIARGFKGPFLAADGRPIHAAGGSEAQELGFVIASAVAYMRALEAAGMSLEAARDAIYFRLAADQNQFLTLAKFRALRELWARVEEACGLAPKPAFVTAETAWRMMTKRDAYGNMVRTTIACAAASLGGANAITVLPYTAALGIPRDHARRVARNTQLILIEESNLHQVTDPATGSGALEAITHDLCRSAWGIFQEIEKAGGVAEALSAGLIQDKVAETRAAHDKDIARRKEAIIGTSDFPDLDEESIEIDPPRKLEAPANTDVMPLRPYRFAEPFEALRDASDAAFAKTGKRPAIFLATLGRPADFTARVTFARSFFSAGGIAPILPETPATTASGEPITFDVERVIADYKKSGEALVCLCSSDKVYADEAEAAAKALKAAGAKQIYLAGKPKEGREALEQAGVDAFIFQGCDTLALLQEAQANIMGES